MIESLEEKITFFETFRRDNGINPLVVNLLKNLDPFDKNFKFKKGSPRLWTPENWASAAGAALSLLNTVPEFKKELWMLFFSAINIIHIECSEASDERKWGNEAEKLINEIIWSGRLKE